MKTRNTGLIILAEEPEKTPVNYDDIFLSIRTPEGDLMTNRVRSLLREYGNRIPIPANLMLEVLEDRKQKSRDLKAANRLADEYKELAEISVETMIDLYTAIVDLLDAIIDAPVGEKISLEAEIEKIDSALTATGAFLDNFTVDAEDDSCE